MGFRFFDPGLLVDGELELIAPDPRWFDDVLAANAACRDPDDVTTSITRKQLDDFFRIAPGGRQPGDPAKGFVPTYHFWMRLRPALTLPLPQWATGRAGATPPFQIAGGIGLRIGHTADIEQYLGHIGYNVHPFARGNHYAERACRLLRPLALRHGVNPLWITCNPDNSPSRRTCERLGCQLMGIVPLPLNHILRQRGDVEKCRYRWEL
jgi:tagatose 1,6-diphosphate aldolase